MRDRARQYACGLFIAVAACCLALACPACGDQIDDPALRLSLTVPPGFAPDPGIVAANPAFAHAFRRIGAGGVDTLLIVERMRALIPQEELDPAALPAGSQIRLFKVRWNGFDIDAFEVPEVTGGVEIVTYNVQVPLSPRAVQLKIIGARAEAADLLGLVDRLVAGLHGETNWTRSPAPPSRPPAPSGLNRPSAYGVVLLVALVAGVTLGFIGLWFVRRRSRAGVVLVLAIVIYAAGWLLAPGPTREWGTVVAGLKMLGFLGIPMGIVDLFWHPAARRARMRAAPTPGAAAGGPPPE